MKRKFCNRFVGFLLAVSMIASMTPSALLSVQAAGRATWKHLNRMERAEKTVSYDHETGTMYFGKETGMSSRMRYTEIKDASAAVGKDYAFEFDVKAIGGAIGIFNVEDESEMMYGLYLDMSANILDPVLWVGDNTCEDNFYYYEQQQGQTPNPVIQDIENWDGATDMSGARLRVEVRRHATTGEWAGGTVSYYKVDSTTGACLSIGSGTIPDGFEDDPDLVNYIGIQVWLGEAEVSNIEVMELGGADVKWKHMSATEVATGNAVYDSENDTMTFGNSIGFDARMNYTGLTVEYGKDYAIEFDMALQGGALGVYNYDVYGNLYGVYLDAGPGVLDAVQNNVNGSGLVNNFWSQDSNTGELVYVENWTNTNDLTSRLRIEYITGSQGILPGGTVKYYKQDSSTKEWLLMGSVAIPDNAVNTAVANYFGVHLWQGTGSISNITVSEIPWIHENVEEEALTTSPQYDPIADQITFRNTPGMEGRMKYTLIDDVSGKDYAIEFDMALEGGAIGVYNYEPGTVELYGVFLDTGAGKLDAVQYKTGQLVDNFAYAEQQAGVPINPTEACENWTEADKSGSRLRVEYVCSDAGTLAGGVVVYYKWDETAQEFVKLGKVNIPTDVSDHTGEANHWGIQVWLGSGTVGNISISDFEQTRVKVGGVSTHTTPLYIPVFDGDTLPKGQYIQGKYIIKWTVNGEEVTTYDASVGAENYVADFVDTKMLGVKVQDGAVITTTDPAEKQERMNVRFISSVNALKCYDTAGFVFSTKEPVPELNKDNCVKKSTTTVYQNLRAAGSLVNVEEIYPSEYSTHMFAYTINRSPAWNAGSTIYVRAFVTLNDGTPVYGDVRAYNVKNHVDKTITYTDGAYSLTLDWDKATREYNTKIYDATNTLVAEQAYNIELHVKHDNAKGDFTGEEATFESIVDNYDNVLWNDDGSVLTAIAEVETLEGSVFKVTDIYTANGTEGFVLDRDIDVLEVGDEDDGFNSIIQLKEAGKQRYSDYEYFIPSNLIRDNAHLQSGVLGSNLGQDYVWIRDSQMGLPMVMVRNKSTYNTLSISRVIDENVASTIDESSPNWIVDSGLDYASTGYSNVQGYLNLNICYPGIGNNSHHNLKRSHPIEEGVEHNYKVLILPNQYEKASTEGLGDTAFTDAMVDVYKKHYNMNTQPNVTADLDKVYDATVQYLDQMTQDYAVNNLHESYSTIYGMPWAIKLNGEVQSDDYQIGYIGQQTSVGYQLMKYGWSNTYNHNSEEYIKGKSIIDFWTDSGEFKNTTNPVFSDYGFPKIWFDPATETFAQPNVSACYLRSMTDGMEGVLDAFLYGMQGSKYYEPEWLNKCMTFADWLVSVQNTDGSYYRAYNWDDGMVSGGEDGKVGTHKNNSACVVRYLVRMYYASQLHGAKSQAEAQKYLDAAWKAGVYILNSDYLQGDYHGGVQDTNNTTDRESAILAMYAFNALYGATDDPNWLRAAQHAAICAASYIYTFDFTVGNNTDGTLNNTYNIYNGKTSGISRISTENLSSDLFSAYTYYEYFKLYIYTGEEFYLDMAELIQDNTKRFIQTTKNPLGYGSNGMATEAIAISNMYYEEAVEVYLPWCSIAMIDPIACMEMVFDSDHRSVQSVIEDYTTPREWLDKAIAKGWK